MKPLDERYELIACDASHADDALDMLKSIRDELVRLGREQFYCMEESDDEFRAFYSDPAYVTLGAICKATGELAATGAGSFNQQEAELFAPLLPEPVPCDAIGYVEFIQVSAKHRGAGLQTSLFEAIEEGLIASGAKYLVGLVSPLNEYSLNNFHKAGYDEVGTTTLSNGFPRLLMAKKAQ